MLPITTVTVALPGWTFGRRPAMAVGMVPATGAAPGLSKERTLEWSIAVKVVNAADHPLIVTDITAAWCDRHHRVPFILALGVLWEGNSLSKAMEPANDQAVVLPLLVPPGERYFKIPFASVARWPYTDWAPWSAPAARLTVTFHAGRFMRYPASP